MTTPSRKVIAGAYVRDGWTFVRLDEGDAQSRLVAAIEGGISAFVITPDQAGDPKVLQHARALIVPNPTKARVDLGGFGELEYLVANGPISMPSAKRLKHLELSFCSDTALPEALPQLESLRLIDFTRRGISSLPEAAPARLVLSHCDVPSDGLAKFTPQHVRSLELTAVRNADWSVLFDDFAALDELRVERCPSFSPEGLCSLASLTSLRLCNVGQISSLSFVGLLPKLKMLVLEGTRVTDDDMSPLLGRPWEHIQFEEHSSYTHNLLEVTGARAEGSARERAVEAPRTLESAATASDVSQDLEVLFGHLSSEQQRLIAACTKGEFEGEIPDRWTVSSDSQN